jgi:NAD(P)-dependent dehydrogenase (short-subunit alcohol dehydrogenase family)
VRLPLAQRCCAIWRIYATASREGRRRKEPWIERDDVTNAILYVESDAGRFVTGTTISVDLGLRAK